MRRIFALCLLFSCSLFANNVAANNVEQATQQLASSKSSERSQAVDLLLSQGTPQARVVLDKLLAGELYRNKKTQQIVTIDNLVDGVYTVSPLFGDAALQVKKRKIKRVSLNNSMRKKIRMGLAQLDISSTDIDTRQQAIKKLLGKLEPETRLLLAASQETESEDNIHKLITTALAIDSLYHPDDFSQEQLSDNIEGLSGELEPAAKNALIHFSSNNEAAKLSAQVERALKDINNKAVWSQRAETLFFGLSLGSVLVLAAIGLAITFGVMGVINMAHGELIMLGAYTTYVVQLLMPNHITASIFVAIPAAFLVSALVGIAIERGVIRFLYGRPLETLLATFGISLILQQAVRSVFSPLNRTVATPEFMSGSISLNPILSLTLNRLYIIVFCLMVFAALFYLLRNTRLGLQVRAVSQNRAMARAMGVRSERVDAMTFGLGSGIAGVAGVALSQLTNVGPNLGQSYIIDSFMVVVFGGVGNLWGTLVAGMALGITNKILEPAAGAVLAKILVLIFIILFIQKRPKGLFPQKGRSAEG